ncbi:MAG: DUF1499 domain-containing protein [Euryarchaeota archaeon]|nr:DUF1499 domain-containing protein [Euryarchaeota archaeon]
MSEDSIFNKWKLSSPYVKWSTAIIAGWIVLILLIQLMNSMSATLSMPTECGEDSMNCFRLAHDETSYASGDLIALKFNATLEEAQNVVINWFDEGILSSVISVEGEKMIVIHGVVHTQFWFFADDVFISMECNGNLVELTLHSQSRLGMNDLGENLRRMTGFHADMTAVKWSGTACEG